MRFRLPCGERPVVRAAIVGALIAGGFADCAHAVVRLTVGTTAQGAQYSTIQAAVNAVAGTSSSPNTVRHVIDIFPGAYVGRVQIPAFKPFITLRGLGRQPSDTVITYNEPANALPNESTNHATVVLQGKDFIAQNLTMANTFGTGGAALALYAKADRLVFDDVRFLGNQDTLRSESGRHFFNKAYVEGTVDFIYGKGTAFFQDATLVAKSNGYFTAQGRETAAETSGYVFDNATLTGATGSVRSYLGRPWGPYSRTVFLNSKMGAVVQPAGWSTWSGDNHVNSFYAEFESRDLSGNLLNVAQRASWSKQLTAAESATFAKAEWLKGSDQWNPVAPSPADFNGDSIVNDDDLGAWRSGIDDAVGNLANGDANRDGVVDGSDFLVWQRSLSGGSPVTVVAEPSGAVLGLLALIGCGLSSGWRRRRADKTIERDLR